MKRWLIIGAIVLISLLIIGWLYTEGYFDNIKWQGFTMLLAALAAPFQFIFGKTKQISKTEEIIQQNLQIRKEEKQHRVDYDQKLKEREQRIKDLDREIELLQSKVELVDKKREQVKVEVEKMTPKEKISEAQSLWGE